MTSEFAEERFYPGSPGQLDAAPGELRLQPATDLDRWHMVLGYTVDNLNAVMAFQAQDFLSGGDPEQISISVAGPEGRLEGSVGMPQMAILPTGACLILPLRSLRLDGREIAGEAKDLRVGFRLDVSLQTYSFDQLLDHPVAGDELKFALKKLLDGGEVSRASHDLASLRCRFTALDLSASLEGSQTQLSGIAEADRPRLLDLLQRWFRSLDEVRNPFFLGVLVLARHAPGGPWLDTEPTLASFAYVIKPSQPRQSQIALLLNCGGIPAPEGHVPGRFVMSVFAPPNPQEIYQGALCVLPKLLITDHLLGRVRAALQMPSAPVGPGFTLRDVRVRQAIHRVNPYGISFNECLRTTDTRDVSIGASGGVDPVLGRYAAVEVKVRYERRMLARRNYLGMNNDQTEFVDSDFDHQYPYDGVFWVTVRFRFTVRERRFVVDRTTEVDWQPTAATADLLWRSRNFGGGHAAMADLYEKELRRYDSELAMLETLRFNLLPERCLLPGRTLLSFRDPQGRNFSTFDRPWALYFSLTRNV